MIRFIRTLILDFTDLLFPVVCLGCAKSLSDHETILCTTCRMQLPETGQHRRFESQQDLLNKFAGKVPIRFLTSYVYFSKGSVVQKLIHNIKYKGQKQAAKEVAGWYGNQLKEESKLTEEIDVVIGVPLHKSRLRQRGYNQADMIAEGIADALNVPARSDILIRNRFEDSQTHKNRLERWENVQNVFSVLNQENIKDKNVVIVDDVLTTGATIEACATELLKAGCKSVGVVTLAVAK